MSTAAEPLTRTSRIYRIAELMIRYRATEGAASWRVVDLEAGTVLPATYADEPMAKAGARLQAACDIAALFEESEGR